MFGPASTLPPDSKAMAEELQRKETELNNLRLQQKQQEQVCLHPLSLLFVYQMLRRPRLLCTPNLSGCLRRGRLLNES